MTSKNTDSSSKDPENQPDFSPDFMQIIDQVKTEERKKLLDYLVSIRIINYSRYDNIYFVEKDGYQFVIEQ